ncbi:MAG: carbohydrate kinase family protein [Candidatus Paceibacterota bacterium]
MFDVITFGSAAWDIALNLPKAKIKKEVNLIVDRGIFFNLGSKIDISNINTNFGGGGVNTATTFALQGLKTAYCGSVGEDIGGREILNYLKERKINTSFVKIAKEKKTNTSVIMIPPNEDRTILVYRGASDCLKENEINWKKLQSRWFYLAPLSGRLSSIAGNILVHAKNKNIKTAVNLGGSQLVLPKNKLQQVFDMTDVLILNLEEASVLTKINYNEEEKIIKAIAKVYKGIIVITKGEYGVTVVCGDKIYEATAKKVKPVDTTGAGDAFAAAFISALIKDEHDIEYAIRLGIANAKGCLLEMGSINGLLSKKQNKLADKEKITIEISDFI